MAGGPGATEKRHADPDLARVVNALLKAADNGKRLREVEGASGLASLGDACEQAIEGSSPATRELRRADGIRCLCKIGRLMAQQGYLDGLVISIKGSANQFVSTMSDSRFSEA